MEKEVGLQLEIELKPWFLVTMTEGPGSCSLAVCNKCSLYMRQYIPNPFPIFASFKGCPHFLLALARTEAFSCTTERICRDGTVYKQKHGGIFFSMCFWEMQKIAAQSGAGYYLEISSGSVIEDIWYWLIGSDIWGEFRQTRKSRV